MPDLKTIKSNYSRISTVELIELSKKPNELRKEIIPVLRDELKSRNEMPAVEAMDALLNDQSNKKKLRSETQDVLLQEIEDRMANGETIESIRIDLNEREIDIAELYNEDSIYKEENFERRLIEEIDKRKQDNEGYDEIKRNFIENEGLSEEGATKLISDAKAKGHRNKEVGGIAFIVGCLVTLFTFVNAHANKGGVYIIAYGAIIFGGLQYLRGVKQSRE
jgi:hypothetical protein